MLYGKQLKVIDKTPPCIAAFRTIVDGILLTGGVLVLSHKILKHVPDFWSDPYTEKQMHETKSEPPTRNALPGAVVLTLIDSLSAILTM